MKYILLSLLFLSSVYAGEYTPKDFPRIADAIYVIEGGVKARAPYGILSVKVKNKADARRVCLNTINNNYTRWIKSGKTVPFLTFLAIRYCPPSADPVGHKNWINNINKVLNKKVDAKKKKSKVVVGKQMPVLIIK